MYCQRCGKKLKENITHCNYCGNKLNDNLEDMLENDIEEIEPFKIIIIISIIVIFILICISVNSLFSRKVNRLLNNNEFETATNLVNDAKLLSIFSNNSISNNLKKKVDKYRMSSIEDFINISDEDWKNIENLNNFMSNTKIICDESNYIYELLQLRESEYFAVYKWYKSANYGIWDSYRNPDNYSYDISGIILQKNFLQKYSFEKYGLDEKYIREMELEKNNLVSYYNDFINAYNANNSYKFEIAKQNVMNTIANLTNLEIEIITKCGEFEQQLAKIINK